MDWNKTIRYVCALVLALVMTGCIPSYKLNGSALDYTVYKTVHVSEFHTRGAGISALTADF